MSPDEQNTQPEDADRPEEPKPPEPTPPAEAPETEEAKVEEERVEEQIEAETSDATGRRGLVGQIIAFVVLVVVVAIFAFTAGGERLPDDPAFRARVKALKEVARAMERYADDHGNMLPTAASNAELIKELSREMSQKKLEKLFGGENPPFVVASGWSGWRIEEIDDDAVLVRPAAEPEPKRGKGPWIGKAAQGLRVEWGLPKKPAEPKTKNR